MKNKVVLYYTNDTSYDLRDVEQIDDFAGQIQFTSYKSRRISNQVSEDTQVITSIGKQELLGYSVVQGNSITNVKLSNRFTTLVVTQDMNQKRKR